MNRPLPTQTRRKQLSYLSTDETTGMVGIGATPRLTYHPYSSCSLCQEMPFVGSPMTLTEYDGPITSGTIEHDPTAPSTYTKEESGA